MKDVPLTVACWSRMPTFGKLPNAIGLKTPQIKILQTYHSFKATHVGIGKFGHVFSIKMRIVTIVLHVIVNRYLVWQHFLAEKYKNGLSFF